MVGEPPSSASEIVRAPVAVVATSSVNAPVVVPAQTETSSAPVMVTVTVCVVESLAAKEYVSVTTSLAFRPCTLAPAV